MIISERPLSGHAHTLAPAALPPLFPPGPCGPLAPGRERLRAEILSARYADRVAEASRLRALAALRSERLASPRYLADAAAIFPVPRPTLRGKPWVGEASALVTAEAHGAQLVLAAKTVNS